MKKIKKAYIAPKMKVGELEVEANLQSTSNVPVYDPDIEYELENDENDELGY